MTIAYEVKDQYIVSAVGYGSSELFLVDMIRERLDRMNLERKYYNRFVPLELRIDKISALVEILDSEFSPLGVERYTAEDRGYPTSVDLLKHYPNFTSADFIAKYINRGE